MVTIVKEFENKLLKRKEIEAKVSNDGATISRKEVKQQLAKKLKVEENLIVVESISSHYGKREMTISACVYEDEKTLKSVTLKHILKRNEEAPKEVAEEEA